MRKAILFLLCFVMSIGLLGCSSTEEKKSQSNVTINLASDNTVNGYRDEKQDNNIITQSDVTAISKPEANNDDVSATYCGNKNSKVFHKSNCASVKTMKAENKYISSSRNALINEGYTPCKRCNP